MFNLKSPLFTQVSKWVVGVRLRRQLSIILILPLISFSNPESAGATGDRYDVANSQFTEQITANDICGKMVFVIPFVGTVFRSVKNHPLTIPRPVEI